MRQKFFFTLAAFLLVVFVLGAVKLSQVKKALAISLEMPPSGVTTIEARSMVWQPMINAIGTLAPVEGVTVAADADGTVVKIAAENGALVKAGDLILSLDTSVESAQLTAAGYSLKGKINRMEAYKVAVGHVEDPDGNDIELVQRLP